MTLYKLLLQIQKALLVLVKYCTKCREEKPVTEFNKASKTKDGLQYHCRACKLQYQRSNPNRKASVDRYRTANAAVCIERTLTSQLKKRAYYTEKSVTWQRNNRDHVLELRRARYKENNAMDIARARRRAGRIRHGELIMNQAEQAEVQGLYDFCRIFRGFEVDHIVPLNGKYVSGLHVLANLQVLPVSQNRSKGNKFGTA